MPANPGKQRAADKQRKRRAAAQQARKVQMAAQRAREAEAAENAPAELPPGADAADDGKEPFAAGEVDYDALDGASSDIQKLVKKKKLDEAEAKARELSLKYPRHSDGLQRLAEVHEARGDKGKAIAALREAAKRPNDGDEEVKDEIEKSLARLGAG